MAIIDVFTYNGEKDMLKLHVDILAPHVDQFVIVEAEKTFSGFTKPLYFKKHEFLVKKYLPRIKYFVVDEGDDELWGEALRSPNTKGANHWKREFFQKESIKKALSHLRDEDIVYIGDVDEIWDARYSPQNALERLRLRVYAYYLDNLSNEAFWGILRGKWGDIKDKCLNHLRSDTSLNATEYGGWHFTSMGGLGEVRRKLNDSYTTETYNSYEIQASLSERLRNGVDFLGRPFEFKIDEKDWPPFLKKNRQKYAHLCKGFSVKPETIRTHHE